MRSKDDFDFDLVFHRHFSGGEWAPLILAAEFTSW